MVTPLGFFVATTQCCPTASWMFSMCKPFNTHADLHPSIPLHTRWLLLHSPVIFDYHGSLKISTHVLLTQLIAASSEDPCRAWARQPASLSSHWLPASHIGHPWSSHAAQVCPASNPHSSCSGFVWGWRCREIGRRVWLDPWLSERAFCSPYLCCFDWRNFSGCCRGVSKWFGGAPWVQVSILSAQPSKDLFAWELVWQARHSFHDWSAAFKACKHSLNVHQTFTANQNHLGTFSKRVTAIELKGLTSSMATLQAPFSTCYTEQW